VTTSHNGSDAVALKASPAAAQSFLITIIIHPGCGLRHAFHCTGAAGKGDVMSVFSTKASFAIAAAVIGAVSLTSFAASAKPFLVPNFGPQKPFIAPNFGPHVNTGCPGGLVGCNPNTWTPGNNGNNWNAGSGGFGLSINLGQPTYAADEGDCYYVRRRVFIPQVGVVLKRQLVCN
jgi:hypothetical protein